MSHSISLTDAKVMTEALIAYKDEILESSHRGKDIIPVSEYFPRSVFEDLLADQNAAGIRIYFSMDTLKRLHTVLVGVDAQGDNILPAVEEEETNLLAERADRDLFSNSAAVYL